MKTAPTTAKPATARKAPLARIRALDAEDEAQSAADAPNPAARRRLIQDVAALAAELCPPTTLAVHVPPWCVDLARAAARAQGATLDQFYSFLLTGCWDAHVFDEGVGNLLRDLRAHVEAGKRAAPTVARLSLESLAARLSFARTGVKVIAEYGPANNREGRAKALREAVMIAEDVLEPVTLTVRLPKAAVAKARQRAAEADITLEQFLGVIAACPWNPLDCIEHVTGYLDDIEGELTAAAPGADA